MAAKTRIDPNRLYRCVEPFAFTEEDGVPAALNCDAVLLGSDAHVQKYPHMFGLEGDIPAQNAARAALVDPEEERRIHALGRQSGVTIMEEKMKAKRAVKLDVDGEERRVRKGEVLDPSELIVSLVPAAFERVTVAREQS